MAKTMAKLQAQARKTSGKKGAVASRVKPKAKAKARPKQTFNVTTSGRKTSGQTDCEATRSTAISA